MVSPLVAVMDQIETLWEALAPPNELDRPYVYIEDGRQKRELMDHRRFWFEIPSGDFVTDFGRSNEIVVWRLEARVHLDVGGRPLATVVEAVANETSLLRSTINRSSTWPTGVDFVECRTVRSERTQANHLDLIFDLTVRTQET